MPAMHAEAGNDSSQMLANIIGRELKRSQQGKFLIQAGSFRSSAEAEPLRQRLDKAGFSSFTEVVDLESKGRWNRVYVGPFTTRGAAERTKRQLRDKLKIEGLLLKKNG